METAKEVRNERNGKEDDKSLVACIVTVVSAQGQLSEGGAPWKTVEENQQTAVTEQRQRQQERKERKQRGEVWIGFVSYAGRRSNVGRERRERVWKYVAGETEMRI